MQNNPVHYYYKDLETGMEMSFSKSEQWGWAVEFHKEDCKYRVAWEAYYTKKDETDAELDALIGRNISDLYEE